MTAKAALIKLHWLLSSVLGFDPRRLLRSLRGLPAFFGDWRRFKRGCEGPLALMPCLHDRYEKGGTFYLSVPIGRERVEFNAHRVFNPSTIADLGRENGLILRALTVIGSAGDVRELGIDENAIGVLAASNYNLAIFTFTKS